MTTKVTLVVYLGVVAALAMVVLLRGALLETGREPAAPAEAAPRATGDEFLRALEHRRIRRVTYFPREESFVWWSGERPRTSSFTAGSGSTIRAAVSDAGVRLEVREEEPRRVLSPLGALTLVLGALSVVVLPLALATDLLVRAAATREGRTLMWAAVVVFIPLVGPAMYLGRESERLGRAFLSVAGATGVAAISLAASLALLEQPLPDSITLGRPAGGP